ncbi:hypothetical protein EC957_006194 [Mortierella hygrophila]|uniref:Uncharacterized protein n=1 Tax=Mortierella hygrophila TaxID=979708 RepID=A0A9P6JZ88_9FUNG|nr:hypothetical protein EC957_006194 [Mortierella hygrophila]
MLKVPALMTHCVAAHEHEPFVNSHCHRVFWHSMVLKPKKWIIGIDHYGLPQFPGNDTKGKVSREFAEETTVMFKNSIEFDASVTVSGTEGSVKGIAELKVNTSTCWTKKISLVVKVTEETEQGYNYQPTHIYAQLLYEVIQAQIESFMVSSFYGDELITTNPIGAKVENKFKASMVPSSGTIRTMYWLYTAFGKDVVTRGFERGFNWQKASTARLKLVVEPRTAMMNITGAAYTLHRVWDITETDSWKTFPEMLDRFIDNEGSSWIPSPMNHAAKLGDYRAVYGEDTTREDEAIMYSPGNLVKVWKVTVRADKS